MEYLSDQKMLALNSSQRSCWITLLCYASQTNGIVKHLDENTLLIQSGVTITSDEYDYAKGVLQKFVELEMICIDNGVITVLNWEKRQQSSLTPYERVKRFREKKRNDNTMITEKITTDKIREEEDINTSEISPKTDGFINKEKYMEKFKKPPKIYSSKQLLGLEISAWSGKKLSIPMIMKFCNDKGEQFVRECWASAKDSTADDKVKIFMYKYGQVKVEQNKLT